MLCYVPPRRGFPWGQDGQPAEEGRARPGLAGAPWPGGRALAWRARRYRLVADPDNNRTSRMPLRYNFARTYGMPG